jgi:hypothetical protein
MTASAIKENIMFSLTIMWLLQQESFQLEYPLGAKKTIPIQRPKAMR